MEKRALLAALAAGLFLVLWYAVMSPPTRPPQGPPGEEQSRPEAPSGVAEEKVLAPVEGEPRPAAPPTGPAPVATRGVPGRGVELGGEGWRAVVAGDGGAIRSLVLLAYNDAVGEPLELVNGTPLLSFAAEGPWNSEPYVVENDGDVVRLSWSDGAGNWAEKQLRPGNGTYGLEVEVRAGGAVGRDGVVIAETFPAQVSAAGRFGRSGAIVRRAGEFERFAGGKLDEPATVGGRIEFAGVEDQYFLLVLLPDEGSAEIRVVPRDEARLEVAAVPGEGGLKAALFAGPKQHEVLVGYGRGLESALSFGFFGFMSVAFLGVLQWIHGVVGNWGVAIIVLTAGIRLPLFPLTHKSTVAMRRMQKLKPKMDAIQSRYKERAKKDPNVRAKMNQEVMALYRQEGVNPMGGCLPTLVQLPILWALYTLFAYAIELRQAPFALWITDLSLKDPTYVLPILMTASMFLQQKIAPQTGDPAQRRMFMMMPLIFGIMFMSFPAGLVLYWLTNNVLTIGQQLVTERLMKDEPSKA